jgi:hypothetical protein
MIGEAGAVSDAVEAWGCSAAECGAGKLIERKGVEEGLLNRCRSRSLAGKARAGCQAERACAKEKIAPLHEIWASVLS